MNLKAYAQEQHEAVLQTVRELCAIPAPSHHEEKRAEYCKNWLEQAGAKGVYIDDALNVIFPLNCEGKNEITVFVAHTDTVFPDLEPLPYSEDEEKIWCPGVGDDTASVAVLLHLAKCCIEQGVKPEKGVLFVCNAGEEGLGNLKGTRQLFRDYEGRVAQFISFDSGLFSVADRVVGSCRYEVEVLTEGGHSWGAFGKKNAIAELAKIAAKIYEIQVPKKENCRVTYNVGTIEGGTSVNTIAQSAKMLCEYRSDDLECLSIMKEKFEEIFASARSEDVTVNVTLVGERPCGCVTDADMDAIKAVVIPPIETAIGKPVTYHASSTDCNIPASLGVPALCVGVRRSLGTHTRQEWLEKASLIPGMEIALGVFAAATEVAL